jgi:hypothetical protein
MTTIEEYLAKQPDVLRAIGEAMVKLIGTVLPGTGAMWQGHPVWSLGAKPGQDPVCLIKAYSSYVTFGIWKGREIRDGSGRLDTAKGMPHVKLRTADDIDTELFTDWLRQASAGR